MKIRMIAAVCAVLVGAGLSARADADTPHRLGAGVNYWTVLDDIDVHEIDDDGFGLVLSYQYKPDLFGFGVDLEILPDRFGDDSFAPQAYVLVGGLIYAGAGIGIVHDGDDFADDPFFSFRAGVDIELVPRLHLDIYGQYRFESRHDLHTDKDNEERIDTDTIYLGAAVRFEL